MQPKARTAPMTKPAGLGDELRAAIDASALTRQEICDAIALDKSVMSRFMARRSGLAGSTIEELCTLLDLHLSTGKRRRRSKR